MTPMHLHLALNHAPLFGVFAGLALLLFGLMRSNKTLQITALIFFTVSGIIAGGVYLTGEPTEHAVQQLAGVSKPIIERHEEAASIALTSIVVLGVASMAGALWFRRRTQLPKWCSATILCLALLTSGFMAWTANLGGQIRHSEIRKEAANTTSTIQQL